MGSQGSENHQPQHFSPRNVAALAESWDGKLRRVRRDEPPSTTVVTSILWITRTAPPTGLPVSGHASRCCGLTWAAHGTRRAGSRHVVGCSNSPERRDAGRKPSAIECVCNSTPSPTGSNGPGDGKGSDRSVFSRYDDGSCSRFTC